METKIIQENISKEKFPLIARLNKEDIIVLFTENNIGTIIYSKEKGEIGEYSENWTSVNGEEWEILDNVTINFKM